MENKKKAILAVSFGTSFHETREKTIDRIEADLAAAYPEYTLYRAWTSKMIITKLKKRDGIVTVSYTHLDVYKRQALANSKLDPELVRKWDERVPKSFGFAQSLFDFYNKPLDEELWQAQQMCIRDSIWAAVPAKVWSSLW